MRHRHPFSVAVFVASAVLVFAWALPAWPQGVTGRNLKAIQDAKDSSGGSDGEAAPEIESAPVLDANPPVPESDEEKAAMERFRQSAESLDQKTPATDSSHYAYGSALRRDPFVSPADIREAPTGEETILVGIQAMRVQEVRMMGIIIFPDGKPRVLVMGSDNMGYWLTEGARLRDGLILSIDPERSEVVFRQDVSDPLAIRPYRDVARQLYPLEEERKR